VRFEAAIDVLCKDLQRRNLKHATVAQYQQFIAGFAARMHVAGIDDARQVRREHIEEHQGYLLGKKLRPRTVAVHTQALRRLFGYLAESGQLLCDPTDGVVALKWTRRLPRRRITETEMRKVLAAPNVSTRLGIRDRAIIEVLYSTAVRAGELLALSVADVDNELGLVHIRSGKGHVERVVPVGSAARKWLKEYVEQVRPYWMKGRDHERRLWVTQSGRPLDINALHALLRVHSKQAGIRPIYPHAIRHAAATHMLAAGADLRMVQKLLGHRCLSSTVIYTRVMPTEVQATHAKTHPLEAEP
jgi:integrase/recombinase XerD